MARPALVWFDGEGMTFGAPELHHALAVRLLVEGDLDHVDGALEAEHLAGKGDGRAPLAGAGLGGDALGPGDLVVVGLGDGGVRLVRAGRRAPFVLVVDLRRGAEGLLQAVGAEERRRPPEFVDLPHLFGDIDPALLRHLLLDQRHGEERQQIVRGHRLQGPRDG